MNKVNATAKKEIDNIKLTIEQINLRAEYLERLIMVIWDKFNRNKVHITI